MYLGEITAEARKWFKSNASPQFGQLLSGRITKKVFNHVGGEVMKVFKVVEGYMPWH